MNKDTEMPRQRIHGRQPASRQRGASLIMVMLILIVVSIIGVGGIQIAMMAERGSRNDRDMQVAWQAAEEGLIDAENDIYGPAASSRRLTFTNVDLGAYVADCGVVTGNGAGLCTLVTSGKPAWLSVNFSDASTNAKTAYLGKFTGRTLPSGTTGVQPYKLPRYIIEPIRDPGDRDLTSTTPAYVYRVTAMGFGPRADIQAVVQMIYRP
jgi:type IV pilus assembly protein PilX